MRNFLIILLIALLVAVGFATCAEIKLAWNPNPVSENVTSYEARAAEVWGMQEVVLKTSATSVTFTGLKPGVPYLFKVRAENSLGLYSDFSDSVTGTPQALATYTLQKSIGLDQWEDRASLVAADNDLAVKLFEALLPQLIKDARGERAFFRVRKVVLP